MMVYLSKRIITQNNITAIIDALLERRLTIKEMTNLARGTLRNKKDYINRLNALGYEVTVKKTA